MARGLRIESLWLAAALSLAAALGASAEPYPSHPLKLVVGFGPASSADILARMLARQMEQEFHQPIVVENRPGNSSMLAAEAVARSTADGYTLFMATVANTLNPAQTHSDFDLARDMAPVALLGVVPNVLVVHPSVPANNLAEVIALARSRPDALTFGTSGAGTASHMAAELFNAKAGSKVVAVHYQGGSSQAINDLLAGRITLMFNVAATLAPHVAAGKLRAIAVAQPRRAGVMPDVPTMEEAGMPGFDAGIWIGLLAPARTPPEIVERLSASANAALRSDAARAALRPQGIDPLGGTPAEFSAFIRADIDKWTSILAAAGLGKQAAP
ncbi:MAG: tripartite tricarboxylate transporter substrate binding protein [Alphaproteobacteria bacterium]|nr:tripartite tricarboxylate transporter substrate binding protein [Alphaproteobacteria bacterium]